MYLIAGRWITFLIYYPHLVVFRRWRWWGIFAGWSALIAFSGAVEALSGKTANGQVLMAIGGVVCFGFAVMMIQGRSNQALAPAAFSPQATGDHRPVARPQLAELLQLRAGGLISDDEYSARRAAVLGLRPSDPAELRPTPIADPTMGAVPLDPLAADKICPDCAETVLSAARICRFCRYEFPEFTGPGISATPRDADSWMTAPVLPRYSGEWKVLFASSKSDLEPGDPVEIVVEGETISIARLGADPDSSPVEFDLNAVSVTGNSSDVALAVNGKPQLSLDWWDGDDGDRLIAVVRERK